MTLEDEIKIAYDVFQEAVQAVQEQADKMEGMVMTGSEKEAEVESLKDLIAEMEAAQDYYASLCQLRREDSSPGPKMVHSYIN